MYEERIKYERETFAKALKYVEDVMDDKDKDRIYRIGIGEVGWNIKRETLSTKKYNELRDEFIAASLAMDGIADEVIDFDEDYVKSFKKSWTRMETAEHFSKNAVKAMEEHFKEQTAYILEQTGETKLNHLDMKYVGSKTYVYKEQFILSFENSPAAVSVRVLVEY